MFKLRFDGSPNLSLGSQVVVVLGVLTAGRLLWHQVKLVCWIVSILEHDWSGNGDFDSLWRAYYVFAYLVFQTSIHAIHSVSIVLRQVLVKLKGLVGSLVHATVAS